ncbi:succinyl-diaminopimelate desuccinylase [Paraburkholderia youngii]|uniref:M20 family metallopeptidase n=1 Tax=Paraburkholderia youngii TaxID=2782701 RepID=UPI003D25139A
MNSTIVEAICIGAYDAQVVRAVEEEVEASRENLVELCGALVAAESANPPGNTAAMARTLEAFLRRHDLPAKTVAADAEAPNIVCTVTGSRPGAHVVFNAHMDTMLAGDESAWTVPPLELTRKDGRLYGLGMGNMKGALAAMALAMKIVQRRLPQLAGKLSLTAVSDEVMFGSRGSPYVLKQDPELYGDYLISGEGPGWMNFAVAEKGLLWLDITAKGTAGHSSRALTGQTAAARMAKFMCGLDQLNDFYADLPKEIEGIEGGENDVGFRLSASVGSIEAGSVRSLIPPVVRAKADLRLPPGLSITDLKARIDEMAKSCEGISIEYAKGWPASWAPLDSDPVKSLAGAVSAVRGVAPRYVVRLPGSDARFWRDHGIASVCYGPQPTLSSGIDDYAVEQDVLDCAAIYALTAMQLMSAKAWPPGN